MAKLLISLIFTALFCSSLTVPVIVEDEDVIDLSPLGPGIFGVPSERTGEVIANWTPEMGNADELGEYFEGDILHPVKDSGLSKSGLIAQSTRWPNKIVPVVLQNSTFAFTDLLVVLSAIIDFHISTCIRFVPRVDQTDYLVITSENSGCWSSVGRVGGSQQLNLQAPGCTTLKGTPIHEFMHALGIVHEHSRTDRDSYIAINKTNIIPSTINNFDKFPATLINPYGQSYNYGSVMHYGAYAFSSNGFPTIIPKKAGVVIGQRDGFSIRDIRKIRVMYRCK